MPDSTPELRRLRWSLKNADEDNDVLRAKNAALLAALRGVREAATQGEDVLAMFGEEPDRPVCPNCHHTQAMHDFFLYEEPAAPTCSCVDPFHPPRRAATQGEET